MEPNSPLSPIRQESRRQQLSIQASLKIPPTSTVISNWREYFHTVAQTVPTMPAYLHVRLQDFPNLLLPVGIKIPDHMVLATPQLFWAAIFPGMLLPLAAQSSAHIRDHRISRPQIHNASENAGSTRISASDIRRSHLLSKQQWHSRRKRKLIVICWQRQQQNQGRTFCEPCFLLLLPLSREAD